MFGSTRRGGFQDVGAVQTTGQDEQWSWRLASQYYNGDTLDNRPTLHTDKTPFRAYTLTSSLARFYFSLPSAYEEYFNE